MSPKLRSLLKQLRDCISDQDSHLITALEQEIKQIQADQSDQQTTTQPSPKINSKTGCYQIGEINTQYCPNCYDQHQQLIKTRRLNSKLRVCPQCRNSLKPS
jgi:NAD-dependent SIR2 family protein deacetylase